jgi:hypothetical protein
MIPATDMKYKIMYKWLISFFTIALLLASCQSHLTITRKKIHKSSKFDTGLSIYKITVDSFAKSGMPVKYQFDSVFSYFAKASYENSSSNNGSKTIFFQKSNTYYNLYAYKDNNSKTKQAVDQIHFVPLRWYFFTVDWNYGLITGGRRTYFFYFDERGKITSFTDDKVNDGPR